MFKKLKQTLGFKPTISDIPNSLVALFGNNTLPPRMGTRELLAIYSQSPWLRTIVNKIGKSVGDTDWALYRMKNGWNYNKISRATSTNREKLIKKEVDINNVVEITDHPLLDLLEYGNEAMLGKTVIQLTCQYLDLVGEAFWVIERNQLGQPSAIWPLPPTWIKDIPSADFPYYNVSADFAGTTQLDIPESEVIYFKEPDPTDPYARGSGLAKSLGDEIEIAEFSSKFTKSFFYNDARPSLIISGDNIGKDDAKRLEQKWLEKHQGFMRAFKPLFFSRKIDVKEVQLKLDEMQLKELRDQERDTFIQIFNCHDEITECLTKDGWKKYNELTLSDKIATYNEKNDVMEYHNPTNIYIYDYNGPLHYWGGFRKSKTDIAVTPHHRMYIGKNRGKEWVLKESQSILEDEDGNFKIRNSAKYYGSDSPKYIEIPFIQNKSSKRIPPENNVYKIKLSLFAEFLGYWLSEGGLETTPEKAKEGYYGIRLHQNIGSTFDRMLKVVEELPFGVQKIAIENRRKGEARTIKFSSKSLWWWLDEHTNHGCKNKKIPDMCFDWSYEDREILLRSLMQGDGCFPKYKFNHPEFYCCVYTTSSEKLADSFQHLAITLGYRATKIKNKIWNVWISGTKGSHLSYIEKSNTMCKEEHYSGKVWCVSVPNEKFFSRRNGKVTCQGNCPPEVLGIVGDSKRSTISAADYFFQKFIVRPRMEQIRAVLQLKLVPQFGNTNKLVLDYESPVVQDEEYKLEVMKSATWAFSINQWKTAAKEKTIGKNGDVYVVPLNQGIVKESNLGKETAEKPSTNSQDNNPDLNKQLIGRVRQIMSDIDEGKAIDKKAIELLLSMKK
jgi:phage portal protein BeeE